MFVGGTIQTVDACLLAGIRRGILRCARERVNGR